MDTQIPPQNQPEPSPPEGTVAPQGTIVLTLPVSEKPGDRIGRYKILQEIGEGGCGVVYMAEQQEPVRRQVALKVIKLGMDTKSVVARFEAERQALAMMDHPNIAKVLDGGATDAGRPFFVMELVRGVKITEYCDQHKLSTEERLTLFMQVCQAIQHAHQKGIIHRDIKPSNILVTLHDGVPVPKVIDFGIAKATQGRLTEQTLFTAFEQIIGTPAYMSPEQLEMSGLDIDTRSDIYALGVLLYELLTGQTPFDVKTLLSGGIDKLRHTIREVEPARPSTRIGSMPKADLDTAARQRHIEPPRLIHRLRGDLDWIVMKTLEKDRTRRYETANGLAMDIQRHLGNEPVAARPPSNIYRFQKLVRRNKVIVVASCAVILALIGGLGLSLYLFIQERAARQRAVAAEQEQARLRVQAEKTLALEAQLRETTENSDRLTRASRLVTEGKPADAEKLLYDHPLTPACIPLLHTLGTLHGRRGEWPGAISNFTSMTMLAPSEPPAYFYLGPIFAIRGDRSAYEENTAQILAHFATNRAPPFAERVVKACFVRPPSAEHLPDLAKIAAPLVFTKTNNPSYPDLQCAAGLSEFRQGHHARAISILRPVTTMPGDDLRAIRALAVLAMAEFLQNRNEQARTDIERALQLGSSIYPNPKITAKDLGSQWFDSIVTRCLLAEADKMIGASGRDSRP